MRCIIVGIALAGFFAVTTLGFALAQSAPTGKLPEGVTPTRYQLDLDVAPEIERFSGEVRIDVTLDSATQVIWLHGRGLEVTNAHALISNGTRIAATYAEVEDSGVVKLETERAIGPGSVTLIIPYSAPFNQSLEGLYRVKQGGQAYAYTHFEALAARRAFPGFDEPRFKTPFDISVTIDGDDTAVSNAPEHETVELNDGRKRVVFQTTKPIPTYLVALAVGGFDVVEWTPIPPNDVRSHPIPLRGIAPKGMGGKLDYALEHTAALLTILEEYFSSPYPYAKLDLVAVAEFNPGGMENVGAIFYRQEKILIDETPSIYQLRGYAYIHAHELAHSWFGNLVTPAWWDDLWLNEAFATWMANRVVHAWRPEEFDDRGPVRSARRAMWSDRLVSARQIRQPIVSDHDIANAFDSITYSKGGGVLSMIERYMGAETFRAGVRRFMARHSHGVATAEDFFDALSASAGDPGVMHAFRSFVEQPGTPMLAVDWSCDDSGTAVVSLKQSRGLPLGSKGDKAKRWSIPICLVYPNGGERQSTCVLMTETAMTVPLPTADCPAWILPNEAGAAYLNFALPDRGWQALIENMDDLQPSEVLSLIGSLGAAYEAGLSTTKRVLDAAQVVAQSPHWDVARAPMQGLRDIKNFILPKNRRSAAFAEMQRIYAPALARFDLSVEGLATEEDNSDLALLRGDLVWFMALDAGGPALRARLSPLGQAYVGYGSDDVLHRDLLHPNLVRVALITAMEEVGLPFAEALIERLRRTDDAVLRNHIIYALGYQTGPALVERVWALILDPATSKRDASRLLRRQGRRVDNAEALLDWIVEHYDALLERLPRRHRAWVVWRLSALCDDADRDRVEAFFAERVKAHRGAPRALANVLEQIELCAAVVKAQRADAVEVIRAPK